MPSTMNITKFKGLIVQPNSFNCHPGSLEKAENVVVKYADMIDKRRGFKDYNQFLTVNAVNNLFTYDAANFAVSSTALFRMIDTPVATQCFCYAGTSIIVVNQRNHGITNNTYISEFSLPDDDPVTSQYSSRQSVFYGSQQISNVFTPTATRNTGVVTATYHNHGLLNADTITITNTGTLSVALTSKTITRIDNNTFTFSDAGINGTGNFSFLNLHAFQINIAQTASASATSGATATTYRYYVTQPGIGFTTTTIGKTRFVGTDHSGYFTSDKGLLKIDSATNPYYRAGIPEGLDVDFKQTKNTGGYGIGPIQANKNISYRVLFARKDANNILVVGAPSQMNIAYSNSYYSASCSVDPSTHVVTVTYNNHGLKALDHIFITNASVTGSPIADNTEFILKTVNTNTFTFDLDDQGLAGTTAIASLYFSYAMSVKVMASIPSELTTDYIIQIFRTNPSVNIETPPDPRYYKVFESQLTSTDITRGFYWFYDEQPSLLLSGAEELYTNYSLEGDSQASHRPPRAKDITLFKNHLFYMNFDTVHVLELNLVNTDLISANDTLHIAGQTYKFVGNAANEYIGNALTALGVTTSGTVATVTAPNAFTAGDVIYVVENTLTIPEGLYTIATAGGSDFTFATTASAGSGEITLEGRTDSSGYHLIQLTKASNTITLAEAIDATARHIVRAVNRNASSTVYASYASLIDNRPGIINFYNKNIEDGAFYITGNSGTAYVPVVPVSGITLASQNTSAPGEIMFSKLGEPECVPLLNRLPVGSKNFEGFRIVALRDSLIIIKQDGVFRLNGNSASNFSVTIIDNTTLCKAKESVAVLNNQVFMFANKGAVAVSDNAVEILSREIEPLLTSITGYNWIENVTTGVSYESERLYILSTVLPTTALNTTLKDSDVVYVYNYLTNAWTTWKYPFSKAYNNPIEDKLYLVSIDGENIYQERKMQSRLDYGDSQYAVPLIRSLICEAITSTGSVSIEVTSLFPHNLSVGDLVTISRSDATIQAVNADVNGIRVVTDTLSDYTFTFDAGTASSGLVVGNVYFNSGVCESDCIIDLTASDRHVTITTSAPHGLNAGTNITINSAPTNALACLTNDHYLLGTRTIITTPTTTSFTVIMGYASSSTLTSTCIVTDKTQDFRYATGLVKSGLQPQIGDMLYCAPAIFRVSKPIMFDATHYCLYLTNPLTKISNTLSYLYSAYSSIIRFTPLTGGSLGVTKRFTEFHAVFRNSDACSECGIIFSTNSVQASSQIDWNARVGTDGNTISYNKWGHSPWGRFSWNQGITIARQYTTAPCVGLRTYIPREACLGTYIQPQIEHKSAGEPFSLQSINVTVSQGSNRTTR